EAGEGDVCMACLSEKAESRRERRTDHCRGELLSCARMISIRFEGTVSAAVAAPLARLGKRRIGFDCSSVEMYDLEAQAALGVAPDGIAQMLAHAIVGVKSQHHRLDVLQLGFLDVFRISDNDFVATLAGACRSA